MKRSAPQNPNVRTGYSVQVTPSADNVALALREAKVLMAPIATWLLRHGAAYPAFAEAMKSVFLDAARTELEGPDGSANAAATQSALSVLSGLHRKDVRALSELKVIEAQRSQESSPRKLTAAVASASKLISRVSLPSQVFTRWLTDKRYRAADGSPRALLRSAPEVKRQPSFEGLCRELSNDVHPRAVLDELLRLGQVALEDDKVRVLATAFIPTAQLDLMNALFSANAADHAAAAVSNITTDAPKFLEQSIFADGLTAESVELLHGTARMAWASAFDSVVRQARERVEQDGDLHDQGLAPMRMRFGVYFFNEAVPSINAVPMKKALRKSVRKPQPAPAVEVLTKQKQPAKAASKRTGIGTGTSTRSKP
jgi:hypothetical protein